MHEECFVTGGSGFIGQHLLARLTRQGHPVSVLLRQPQTLPQLQQQVEQLGGDGRLLRGVAGDLSHAQLGLDRAARQQVARAAAVFHLGGRSGPPGRAVGC